MAKNDEKTKNAAGEIMAWTIDEEQVQMNTNWSQALFVWVGRRLLGLPYAAKFRYVCFW